MSTDNPDALGPLTHANNQQLRLPKYVKVFVLFLSPVPFSPPFAVLGCQAILVSDRNKSFRRGSVGLPLSSTKSSRIRSQRLLSPQPAGLGEIYCEERGKKSSYFMALSWWNLAKAVLAGGIRGTQRVWLCVTLPILEPLPLTHHHPSNPKIISPFPRATQALAPVYLLPRRCPGISPAQDTASSLDSSIIKIHTMSSKTCSPENSIIYHAYL